VTLKDDTVDSLEKYPTFRRPYLLT